jgi:hypothetical protein
VLVATSPLLGGIGGRYFEDCDEAAIIDPEIGHGRQRGVAAYALDPQTAARFWDVSLQMFDRWMTLVGVAEAARVPLVRSIFVRSHRRRRLGSAADRPDGGYARTCPSVPISILESAI